MTSPLSEVHRNKTMTRSKIASKILSETPPETREKVKKYGDKVVTIAEALRQMGHYFDLPEKEVKFYIRQLELSKKI